MSSSSDYLANNYHLMILVHYDSSNNNSSSSSSSGDGDGVAGDISKTAISNAFVNNQSQSHDCCGCCLM